MLFTCHVSCVMCHMSYGTYHMSHVTCHYLFNDCFIIICFGLGGTSCQRVCYRRGLTSLYFYLFKKKGLPHYSQRCSSNTCVINRPGAQSTNPLEEFKMRKTTLEFCARNAQFSDNDKLQTDFNFCLFQMRRGGLGVVGWILDI